MTENLKQAVVKRYSERIKTKSSCCGDSSGCSSVAGFPKQVEASESSCCAGSSCTSDVQYDELKDKLGDVSGQSFGCGNPIGQFSVMKGDTVVDLGSGAGLDCIRAVSRVGATGKIVGVDMSEEMIAKATQNVIKMGLDEQVSFVKGDIEDIPLTDNFATLVISNCVLALAPNKQKVFNEVYRILKPGGRFIISDVVSAENIPQEMKDDVELFSNCISGASQVDEYYKAILAAGFTNVEELERQNYGSLDASGVGISLYSITVKGYKYTQSQPIVGTRNATKIKV